LKKQRRTKDDEYFTILHKLVFSPLIALRKPDFELPRIRIKSQTEELKPEISKSSYVPHSSLIDRLNELKEIEAIVEYDIGQKSKKNLPVMGYYITLFGLIKFLALCATREFIPNLLHHSFRLAYIFTSLKFLQDVFSEKQLFDALVEVCKNTQIEIDYEPWELFKNASKSYLSKKDILEGKKAVKLYRVIFKVQHIGFSFRLRQLVPCYAYEREGKKLVFEKLPIDSINKMIACIFYHELISRCLNPEFQVDGFPFMKALVYVTSYLKSDKEVLPTYLEILREIEIHILMEKDNISTIHKLLPKRKRSDFEEAHKSAWLLTPSSSLLKDS